LRRGAAAPSSNTATDTDARPNFDANPDADASS
jgi:hypothetical protein